MVHQSLPSSHTYIYFVVTYTFLNIFLIIICFQTLEMKLLLLCALFGAALSEVFFEEQFNDGDAWESR